MEASSQSNQLSQSKLQSHISFLNQSAIQSPSQNHSASDSNSSTNMGSTFVNTTTITNSIIKPHGSLAKNICKALNLQKIDYQGYRVSWKLYNKI